RVHGRRVRRVPRGRARGAQIGVPSPPGPRAEERFQPLRITPLQRSQNVPGGIAVAVEDDPLKPDLPLLSQSADRVGGLCLRLKLVSEDLEHTQVISHDNHALGTAHAFAHVTSKTDLAHHAPARSVCTAAAVASLRARFSHSCGINVSLASLGRYARTCERYHGLFSPGSRPTASSQTLSASPTGLRARWACRLMVL